MTTISRCCRRKLTTDFHWSDSFRKIFSSISSVCITLCTGHTAWCFTWTDEWWMHKDPFFVNLHSLPWDWSNITLHSEEQWSSCEDKHSLSPLLTVLRFIYLMYLVLFFFFFFLLSPSTEMHSYAAPEYIPVCCNADSTCLCSSREK